MTITIHYDMDSERFVLMASSHGFAAMPAGPRLFRAPPHPDIRFQHETKASAEADARKLRTYLAEVEKKKGPSKKEMRGVSA